MNRFRMAVLALPLVASAALPAAAGTITNVQAPLYQGVTLTGGTLGSSTMAVGIAGQVVLTTDSGILGTWCVDLYHQVSLGGKYAYSAAPLATDNRAAPNTQLLSADQISGIQQLAAFGNAVLDAATDRAYTISADLSAAYAAGLAAYTTAVEGGYQLLTSNLAAFSAAIQASIWGIEYGTRLVNPSAILSQMMGAIADGQEFFSGIGGYQLNLANGAQRLYTPEVPEPASFGLLALGLLALAFAANRRKTAAV